MEQYLTMDEVSKALKVSPGTLRKWDKEGKLPAVRLPNGHRRYRQVDIDKMLQDMNPT